MIHYRPIVKVLGFLLMLIGLLMTTAFPVGLYFDGPDGWPLLWSALICMATGGVLLLVRLPKGNTIRKREGYLIVALGWLVMVTFGMLPYLWSGTIPSVADAFFETVSGMTTTGATTLTDIEALPKGILYWRSLTQWIGGMGIIVLTVAILPILGIGGIELFAAEAPGPTSDKVHPRIRETAKRLWLIYVGLTAAEAVLLWIQGMSPYEAVNHALTTMATGGFSTRNDSIAAFPDPLMQYTIIFFMFLAGTNYTVLYFGVTGRFRQMWRNEEYRTYLSLTLGLGLIVTIVAWMNTGGLPDEHGHASLEATFRAALFHIVSLMTTTGYVTTDYTTWSPGLSMLFFVLLFFGASAGSTAGGIKIIRHLVFFKNSFLEFKRLIHPKAIVPLKIDGKVVAPRIMTHVIIFLLLYILTFIIGALVIASMGYDFETTVGAVATSLGNVGPGIGSVGPVDNFAHLSASAKIVLSMIMLLGRLELFTILVLFTPYFWRTN